MTESVKNRIFAEIKRRGKGHVFSASDFLKKFKRFEVDRSLTDLQNEGCIVRIMVGLYYYPQYNSLLKRNVAPDMQKVAKAIARKNNWIIFPEGNTALNYLALSTQVPANYVYISSGKSKKYTIGNTVLEFNHQSAKGSVIRNENANLVVQAIIALGKVHATQDEFIQLLATKFSYKEWDKIEKASNKVTYWVLDIIKKAKEYSNG